VPLNDAGSVGLAWPGASRISPFRASACLLGGLIRASVRGLRRGSLLHVYCSACSVCRGWLGPGLARAMTSRSCFVACRIVSRPCFFVTLPFVARISSCDGGAGAATRRRRRCCLAAGGWPIFRARRLAERQMVAALTRAAVQRPRDGRGRRFLGGLGSHPRASPIDAAAYRDSYNEYNLPRLAGRIAARRPRALRPWSSMLWSVAASVSMHWLRRPGDPGVVHERGDGIILASA